MQGDGKTSFDVGNDGVPTMIGECAVRADVLGMSLRVLTNVTGRLSLHQHSDEAQGYLFQGHGWTYVNPFSLDSILTFNADPGENPVKRLCVFYDF